MRSLVRVWLCCFCLAGSAFGAAEVRSLLKRAQQAYDLAQFDAALADYAEVYRLDPRPAILFNMAQCHRQLGNYERAAFFYRRYLDLSPKRPANAATVQELLREVEARQAEVERQQRLAERTKSEEPPPAKPNLTPQTVPSVETPPPAVAQALPPQQPMMEEKPLVQQWWFWTAVGAGVAAVAAGTAVGIHFANQTAPTSLEPIHVPGN